MNNNGNLESISELFSVITPFKRALILAHANPDSDAYGSSCGLGLGLRNLGFQVEIYNESGIVSRLSKIPGVNEVKSTLPAPSTIGSDTVVIVCDCGAAERVGESYVNWLREVPTVVNIDHHHANTLFGRYNFVPENASSTSEIVYSLLIHGENVGASNQLSTQRAIDVNTATALFAGIVGDTGSFRYPSTTEKTFEAAAELYRRGARPSEIAKDLFASISLPAIRLQSEALSKIELSYEGKFAEVVVTAEMVSRLGAELLDADSLAERARDVQGVTVAALFKEDTDMWRVSLRSNSPLVDVSAVARSFGGGGHKPAAAFRWRKDFETLQQELRSRMGELLAGTFVAPESSQ
jgi:phosphoesterase RecJ-like protein